MTARNTVRPLRAVGLVLVLAALRPANAHAFSEARVNPRVEPRPSEAGALADGPPGDNDRTPWTRATDAGVTIGRASQDAGVATAGFFTRVLFIDLREDEFLETIARQRCLARRSRYRLCR